MALVYRCDRCKREKENESDFLKPIDIPRVDAHDQFTDKYDNNYRKSLCASCWKLIISLIENKG